VSIQSLQISNLRNISQAKLAFGPGLNLISGDNGSGKSSLLEAIYLIARGRSYRTSRFGSVIRKGESTTTLFAQTQTDINHRIGLQKTPNTTRVKVDGRDVDKLSEIARITPLQIITPMSHEILERGPEFRRRFLEWGVFHVEQNHFSLYRKFAKGLRQRNMALKNQNRILDAWDSSLGQMGDELDRMRTSYFNELTLVFSKHAEKLGLDIPVSFAWKKGWKSGLNYTQALKESREADLERGFTNYGPHRADFKVELDGRSAFNTASRGQQKMIIVGLHLAQASILKARLQTSPVILIDDLVSELDKNNRTRLIEYLDELNQQVFVTSTDALERTGLTNARGFKMVAGVPMAMD